MDKVYYDAVSKMEEIGVNEQYKLGWMSGYHHMPKVEEQRITDDYETGYEAGTNKSTDDFAEHTA